MLQVVHPESKKAKIMISIFEKRDQRECGFWKYKKWSSLMSWTRDWVITSCPVLSENLSHEVGLLQDVPWMLYMCLWIWLQCVHEHNVDGSKSNFGP